MSTYAPNPPLLLNQDKFSTYSNAWVQAVRHNDSLPAIFQQDGQKNRSSFVRFPLQDIVWLLSTVGARRVKAQFLVKPDEGVDADPLRPRFTIALFATDALDGRISAYFLGNNLAPKSSKIDEQVEENSSDTEHSLQDTATVGGQLPHGLAGVWLKNWLNLDTVTSDLFTTNYGPLQGYVFDMDDFLDPMFFSQGFFNNPDDAQKYELRVGFGLHEFYPAFPDNAPRKQTFGLLLRIYDKATDKVMLAADGSDNPFYDISTTNPPGLSPY
jgi:hypothetical protein